MRIAHLTVSFLIICSVALAAQIILEVTNPESVAKKNEIVAADWSQLKSKVSELTPDNARVVGDGGKVLLSQPVDNDGDGKLDELLFVADMAAGAKTQFNVVADDKLQLPASDTRVYARYVPERSDDFAWENDVVAFRAYGPALEKQVENCGFDCFLKRVKYPILDKWYVGERLGKSYHVDFGEGYDGYKVGSSLGCGGSAVWSVGKLFLSDVYHKWEQSSNGPLRASFTLTYGPWQVNGLTVTEKKRITLELGKRLFRVDDSFFVDGKPARLDIAVGLTTHEGDNEIFENRKDGILYGWETIDKSHLGTAVLMSPEIIKDYKLIVSKKKFEGNAFFIVDTGDDGRFTYWAGYGWEKAGEITTREQWESYLNDFLRTLNNPIVVKIN